MSETVEIEIHIKIDTEGVVDTGLTVDQWNALTPGRRSAIYQEAWETEAFNADGGGVRVVTEGAEQI